MIPEYLYIINGLEHPGDMGIIRIDEYKIKRDTPKYWICWVRGAERKFPKVSHKLHTQEQVKEVLMATKKRRLEAAERLASALQHEITVPIHRVPEQAPPTVPGEIQL